MRSTLASIMSTKKPLSIEESDALYERLVQAVESGSDITISSDEALDLYTHLSTSVATTRLLMERLKSDGLSNLVGPVAQALWERYGGVVG